MSVCVGGEGGRVAIIPISVWDLILYNLGCHVTVVGVDCQFKLLMHRSPAPPVFTIRSVFHLTSLTN